MSTTPLPPQPPTWGASALLRVGAGCELVDQRRQPLEQGRSEHALVGRKLGEEVALAGSHPFVLVVEHLAPRRSEGDPHASPVVRRLAAVDDAPALERIQNPRGGG